MEIILRKSDKKDKKFKVTINNKTIYFGNKGSSDFTINKNEITKENYLKRHQKRENWNLDGILSAGFWARWLLWNKDTIDKSVKDIENRFNIKIL
jgi:hypothetical protein